MKKKTTPKPIDLGAFLKEKKSPLADYVPQIMKAANKWRIDPRLIIAIAGGESSFGRNARGFNAWGIGPGRTYASWDAGIDAAAHLLRHNYVGKGLKTLASIGSKWAPLGVANDPTNLNSNWYRNNSTFYSALGGDVKDVTRDWRKGAAPKVVAKQPSQKTRTIAGVTIPFVPGAPPPSKSLLPDSGFSERAAFASLGRISQGFDPSYSMKLMVEEQMSNATARAAAQVTARELQPKVSTPDPVEDKVKPTVTPTGKPAKPLSTKPLPAGGGWGGSYSVAKALADIGKGLGLTATSEKRDRKLTASGNPSDHWVGSKDSYAFDLSNGSAPTEEMDKAAAAIAARLGIKYDGKSPLLMSVTRNGYRIQLIWRSAGHYDHVHLGVRRSR